MNTYPSRQLTVTARLDDIMQIFLPESEPQALANQLLNACLRLGADCHSERDNTIDDILWILNDLESTLQHVADGLKVIFSRPKKMKERRLYLAFNPQTGNIVYAMKLKDVCYTGEISDDCYSPMTEKLKSRGLLSLKEVNFLLQKEIIKKSVLPKDTMVVDPVCRRIFRDFARHTVSEKTQAVMYLKEKLAGMNRFRFSEPASLYQWPPASQDLWHVFLNLPFDEIEKIIETYKEELELSDAIDETRKQETLRHSILPQKKENKDAKRYQRNIDLNIFSDVHWLAERIVPHSSRRNPTVVEAARMLFVGYALYVADTLPLEGSGVYYVLTCLTPKNVGSHIQQLLKRTRTVSFSPLRERKEGAFHLWLDEETQEIRYAVMKKIHCYQGVIIDPVYNHFKRKLQKIGRLTIKEVNFLIERVLIPRKQIRQWTKAIDPLCAQSWMNFLSLAPEIQQSATQMLKALLEPWSAGELHDNSPQGFYEMAPPSRERIMIEEKIVELQHFKKYFRSRQLMSSDAEYFFDAELYQARIEREEKIKQRLHYHA